MLWAPVVVLIRGQYCIPNPRPIEFRFEKDLSQLPQSLEVLLGQGGAGNVGLICEKIRQACSGSLDSRRRHFELVGYKLVVWLRLLEVESHERHEAESQSPSP